ncbi:hypothetical protein [Pseudomonas mandelii]
MSARDVNPVSTHVALQALGFRCEPKVYSEQETGLSYDFGSFQLTAARMMNLQMREAWHFSGLVATSRSVAQIEFEMPLQLDSAEQCAAWIAWALERQRPRNERLIASFKQELVILGLQHQSTLPWVRRQAAHAARPHCWVERSWMRLLFKTLAGHVSKDDPDDRISIRFDGAVLSFHGRDWTIPVPANGNAWTAPYAIKVRDFSSFPARLMQTEVGVSIWEDNLTIGNRFYRGIAIAQSAAPTQHASL